MMNQLRIPSSRASISEVAQTVATLVVAALLLAASIPACAQTDKSPTDKAPTYSVLYTFTGGADGANPVGANPLAIDREGNLYGTTISGGYFTNCGLDCGTVDCSAGCGTVFKVNRDGRESVEYTFTGGPTEQDPESNVIRDEEGNLYGSVTSLVYKISPSGHETDLYQFPANGDGGSPSAALIRDREGNLYGVSDYDGPNLCPNFLKPYGSCGFVFKIDPRGRETVLYTFTGGADGGGPEGALVRDEEGNLYGTTLNGGEVNSPACTANLKGCGVIFKIDRHGKETVLHTFDGVGGGIGPPYSSGLTRDRDGTLYGTTFWGGQGPDQFGYGTVYKLERNGKFTTLYNFTGKADGGSPTGPPLLIGKDLYGTTRGGGKLEDDPNGGGPPYYGTSGVIYKLDQSGKETVLYAFPGGADGADPISQLTQDDEGNLYGTTLYGGTFNGGDCEYNGCGVVYKLALHNKCDDDRHHHDGWPNPFSNHDDREK
jgi:uncharacterized repeat protein (TIGR03803 family)